VRVGEALRSSRLAPRGAGREAGYVLDAPHDGVRVVGHAVAVEDVLVDEPVVDGGYFPGLGGHFLGSRGGIRIVESC